MKVYKTKKELIGDLIPRNGVILDVGFWGQAVGIDNPNWVHNILKSQAKEVYGVDLFFDENQLEDIENYKKQSAEDFDFEQKFDVIFAGDLIEHLSNPGLFLASCKRNLKKEGVLILATPNCFAFFNLAEKCLKPEIAVNNDHTMYFDFTVLATLLRKNRWSVVTKAYLDDGRKKYKLSLKRKIIFVFYKFISIFTAKFSETLVIVAQKNEK